MEFAKRIRFGQPYWFSGIYKIASYEHEPFSTAKVPTYYQAYHLAAGNKNWGDYMNRAAQKDKKLTFAECVSICEEHAKTYEPTPKQRKQADKAMCAWIDMDSKNAT